MSGQLQHLPKSLLYAICAAYGAMFLFILMFIHQSMTDKPVWIFYTIGIVFLFAICLIVPVMEQFKITQKISSKKSIEILLTVNEAQMGFATITIDKKSELRVLEGNNSILDMALEYVARKSIQKINREDIKPKKVSKQIVKEIDENDGIEPSIPIDFNGDFEEDTQFDAQPKIQNPRQKISMKKLVKDDDPILSGIMYSYYCTLYDSEPVEFLEFTEVDADQSLPINKEFRFDSVIMLTTIPFSNQFEFVSDKIEKSGYLIECQMSFGNHAQLVGWASTLDKIIPIIVITHSLTQDLDEYRERAKEINLTNAREDAKDGFINTLLNFIRPYLFDLSQMKQHVEREQEEKEDLLQQLAEALIPKTDFGLPKKISWKEVVFCGFLFSFGILAGVLIGGR